MGKTKNNQKWKTQRNYRSRAMKIKIPFAIKCHTFLGRYFGDYVKYCDLVTRAQSVHYALVHTMMLIFFTMRLDFVQPPITFWWDRKRRLFPLQAFQIPT